MTKWEEPHPIAGNVSELTFGRIWPPGLVSNVDQFVSRWYEVFKKKEKKVFSPFFNDRNKEVGLK